MTKPTSQRPARSSSRSSNDRKGKGGPRKDARPGRPAFSKNRDRSRPSSRGGGRMEKTGGRGGPQVRKGALRARPDVADKLREGHQWIYSDSVRRLSQLGRTGDVIDVLDPQGGFIGKGIVDTDGPVVVRIATRIPRQRLDGEFWKKQIVRAVQRRKKQFNFETHEAVRLVNGGSDGIPTVFVDKYGPYLVVQLYSPCMNPFKEMIYDALFEELSPMGIYEQRRFKSLAGDAPKQASADLVRGTAAPIEFSVREGDLSFWVDVTSPLSTGLFSDLREGRKTVKSYSKEQEVLNLFSYTGALSVAAVLGGAKSVTAVDVSAKAHARARKNLTLNKFEEDTVEHIVGDAFKVLTSFAKRDRLFDFVVIDPPAFGSGSQGGKPWVALQDYDQLIADCLKLIRPGGALFAASSTKKMQLQDFEAALFRGAQMAKKDLQIARRIDLPPDFSRSPGFVESNYLKCVLCWVD